MKKILFLAVSAVLLAAGCQKTEIQNETLTPIGFGTHMGKLTKAPDAENAGVKDNLIEQGFHVWGFFDTPDDLNYSRGDKYLDNIIVSNLSKDGTTWTTDDTYYWPGKNKELNIYAISSFDEDYSLLYGKDENGDQTCNIEIDYTLKTLTVNDFTVDQDADNDLMVAPMIKQDQDDAKYIEPEFEHALTKVVVKFREKGESIVHVKSAKTSPINSTAKLVVSNTLGTESAGAPTVCEATWEWSAESVPVEYEAQCKIATESVTDVTDDTGQTIHNAVLLKEMTYGETVTVYRDKDGNSYSSDEVEEHEGKWYKKDDFTDGKLNEGADELTVDTQATVSDDGYITYGCWLLIPQKNITGYYLDVEYIVDGMLIQQRFKLDSEIKEWKRSQQITYNVTISPDYIEFEPEVDDWITDKNPSEEENYDN